MQEGDRRVKLKNRFYHADRFRTDAIEAVDVVDLGEAQGWVKHPCTQALKSSIQADMCSIINSWIDGGFGDGHSSEATAMMQAKALGIIQTLDDLLDTIEDIGVKKLEGEDNGDNTNWPQDFS